MSINKLLNITEKLIEERTSTVPKGRVNMLDTKDIAFPLTVKLSDYIEEAAKKNNIKLKKLFVKKGFVTGQVNLFIDFYEDKIDEVLSLLDNLLVKEDYKNLGFHARRSLHSSTVRKIFNRTYIKKFEYTFTEQNKSPNDFIIEGIGLFLILLMRSL